MKGVEAIGVSYSVGSREIIHDITFELEEGKVLAILGPNGVGKTTLLRILSGIIPPSRGKVYLYGENPAKFRRFLTYIPANYNIDMYARSLDIMLAELYNGGFFYNRRDIEKIRMWASYFGVERYFDTPFGKLSSGEQKLVLLAGGLARDPKIMILDEPTAFLDISNQAKILSLIREIAEKEGITIVFALHEIYYGNIADYVMLMKDGKLIKFGNPNEVLNKDLLVGIYGIELEGFEINGSKVFLPKFSKSS